MDRGWVHIRAQAVHGGKVSVFPKAEVKGICELPHVGNSD